MLREAGSKTWKGSMGLEQADGASGTGEADPKRSRSQPASRVAKRAALAGGLCKPQDDEVAEMHAELQQGTQTGGAFDDEGDESDSSEGDAWSVSAPPGQSRLMERLEAYFESDSAETPGGKLPPAPLRSLPSALLRGGESGRSEAARRARSGQKRAASAMALWHTTAALESEMMALATGTAGRAAACVRACVGDRAQLGPERLLSLGLADVSVAWRRVVLREPSEMIGTRQSALMDAVGAAVCSPRACAKVLKGVGSTLMAPAVWRSRMGWEAGALFATEQLEQLAIAAGWETGPGRLGPLLVSVHESTQQSDQEDA
jgi:hypothetical protein